MKNEAAITLGRKGGMSKSESKSKAARENGKKGGRPTTYYAIHWKCGKNTRFANSGNYCANVYRFERKDERDSVCKQYTPPNHCPSAIMEPASSGCSIVRKAVSGNNGFSEVINWDGFIH